MTHYRLYFHDAAGHFMRAEHVDAADDDAALEAARELDHAYCIEVWDKGRIVGIVKPGPGCSSPSMDIVNQKFADAANLLVGSHAQVHRLGRGPMTEHVRAFRDHLPRVLPLPHPSWRSLVWMKRHPWFEADVLPALRAAARESLA